MANEPVAWHYPDGKPDQCTTDKAYAEKDPAWTPMYYKHEWVGLTDEEIYSLWEMAQIFSTPKHFYTLMEAKLKEKMCL
jgi:superfamily I DNA and RNA helicase